MCEIISRVESIVEPLAEDYGVELDIECASPKRSQVTSTG